MRSQTSSIKYYLTIKKNKRILQYRIKSLLPISIYLFFSFFLSFVFVKTRIHLMVYFGWSLSMVFVLFSNQRSNISNFRHLIGFPEILVLQNVFTKSNYKIKALYHCFREEMFMFNTDLNIYPACICTVFKVFNAWKWNFIWTKTWTSVNYW